MYARSGQFGGGDLRQYLHRGGYQIAGETSPRFDQGGGKRRAGLIHKVLWRKAGNAQDIDETLENVLV